MESGFIREVIMKGDNRMKKGIISILSMLSGAAAGAGIVKRREKVKLVQRFFDAHILSRLFLTSIFPVKCFGC